MWGQDSHKATLSRVLGIIPTRVGTSRAMTLGRVSDKDHPHACGDKTQKMIEKNTVKDHPHACGDK